jgi:EmrB/QacA subfamily drug resistance transporter
VAPKASRFTRGRSDKVGRYTIFAVASGSIFMLSIDATILAGALPSVGQALHTRITWVAWTITAFQLGQGISMPIAGRISDQFGRKRVFISSVCVFTTASLCCALATSVYELVAFRAIQAVAGGAFLPATTGMLSEHFGTDRDRAIGLLASIFPVGGISGPVLGGVIITLWSWRGVFLINIPIGVLIVIAAIRFLPPDVRQTQDRTDVIGALEFGIAVLGLMLAITNLGSSGVELWSPTVLGPLAISWAVGGLFVRRMKSASHPIIPLTLFHARGFMVMNIVNTIFGACVLGVGSLIPFYAQVRFHISVLRSSTLLTARAVGMIVVSGIAAVLLRRTGYRKPIAVGFGLIAAGFVALAFRPGSIDPYWWLVAVTAISGIGFGFATPAANNALLALAPEDVSAVTGMRGLFRQSGGIISTSIIAAFVARSADQGLALATAFELVSLPIVGVIPLLFFVPDQRGPW